MSSAASAENQAIRQDMPPELAAYYADAKLMWRNVILIGIATVGWNVALVIIGPLMVLHLLSMGVREGWQGTIASINQWAVCFLVMYFSWKSDHTISRLGRRKPYLFFAAPFIIAAIVAFPFIPRTWALIAAYLVYLFFMDMKASTFPLLNIDCVPRHLLARMNSIFMIVGGIATFLAMRLAGRMVAVSDWLPYMVGASVMTLTTLAAVWIKEPPIFNPPTERFRPWSTFKVGWRDKRMIWLMLGVAMINGFFAMYIQWIWLWSRQTLNLERQEIFDAISWSSLIPIVMAYPIGWAIDRFGGLRIVLIYWVLQLGCFALFLNTHDRHGLLLLAIAFVIVAPLYAGADMMVYKSAPSREVGSMTSTNSFVRNAYLGLLTLVSGVVIQIANGDYRPAFILGMVMSAVGLVMFLIHNRVMQPTSVPLPQPTLDVESAPSCGNANQARSDPFTAL